MKRSHFTKVTLLSFSAIALLSAAAAAQAQPENELPPLQPPPKQPAPWVAPTQSADQPPPAEKPAEKPLMRPPPERRMQMEAQPVDLGRMTWRPPQPAAEPETPAPPPSKTFFQLQGSLGGSYVTDPAFGMFQDEKWLARIGLAASYTVLTGGDVSFAPGLAWEYGAANSKLRGDDSELAVHRLSLRLEGRYHVLKWMYAFARVAPGAMRESLQVQDLMAPAPLRQSFWVPSADLSAGAAFLVAPHGAQAARNPRFWMEIDGGYGWAGRKDIVLVPDLPEDDVRRVGTLALGDMALRGAFVRVAASFTY